MTPDEDRTPERRLEAFVERERRRMNVRFPAEWDDPSWVVKGEKPVSETRRLRLFFTPVGPRAAKGDLVPFEAPFDGFARALCNLLAHRLHFDPGSSATFLNLMTALRFVYAALPEGSKDPTGLQGRHLKDAEEAVIAAHDRGTYAAVIIEKIEAIGEILDDERLTVPRTGWRRNFRFNARKEARGPAAAKRAAANLLDDDEMHQWATWSADPGADPYERLRQRLVDLMVCGGFRMHEALTLPVDTLFEEQVYGEDGCAVFDRRGRPVMRHGLRYWPHKGNAGAWLVKPIPTAMAPIAARAVEEVKTITRRARAAARAFHDGATPFDEDPWDMLADIEDCALTGEEVGLFLGFTENHQMGGLTFIRENGIPSIPIEIPRELRRRWKKPIVKGILKKDLEETLRRKTFDRYEEECKHGIMHLHDCLFVLPVAMFRGKPGYDGSAQLLSTGALNHYLRERYPRLAMRSATSEGATISTHMFRRWLATSARRGGLTHLDLSAWLGHEEVESTFAYDLRPVTEVVDEVRDALEAMNGSEGPVFDPAAVCGPEGFDGEIEAGTIGHATVLGVCSHDLQSPPCPAFLASLDGRAATAAPDRLAGPEIDALLRRLDSLKAAAEEALADGIVEAEAWLEANERWRAQVEAVPTSESEGEGHGAKAA